MTPAFLYRHFDGDGRLLYVGATIHPTRRQAAHLSAAAWGFDVRRIEIEPFGSKAEAFAAERAAQESEGPLYNVPRRKLWDDTRARQREIREASRREAAERRRQAEAAQTFSEAGSAE